jgi:hypothetical protein
MNLRYFFLILVCLPSFLANAQTLVTGKVSDSSSGDPVPFVNIIITDLAKGTVSNLDGEFNFRLPDNAEDEMEVVFSHIGYRSVRFTIAELKRGFIDIKMSFDDYELNQAIVLDFDPKEIMKRAQENLINTQYGKPHEIEVFYRELIWVNDTIMGLTRARGDLHSEGYDIGHSKRKTVSGKTYQYAAYNQIQKSEYGLLTNMYGKPRSELGNGSMIALIFRLWNFNLNWFDYELIGGRKLGDREVYVLSIKAKNNGVKSRANRWGKSHYGFLQDAVFYIDQEDYGVHMMELSQYFPSEKEVTKYSRFEYLRKGSEAVVKFRRDVEGNYFFTYANYTNRYREYGYQTEKNPRVKDIKEFAELYALGYELRVLSDVELRSKYHTVVSGEIPFRSLAYHVDWYNSLIFIAGKARYNSEFWEGFDYPRYPGEKELERQLTRNKPLSEQFAEFRNNQFYLLPLLKKRNGLNEGYWGRTGLYSSRVGY